MADIKFVIDVDGTEKVVKLRTETQKVAPAAKTAGERLDGLSRRVASFGNTTNGARKNTNRFNATIQNAGYQFGDFFVQVQSGQNALVAFSQQGAQLAGLLPGVAGAVTGLAIVLGSMLARNLLANIDLFKGFTERLKDAKGALDDLRTTSSTLARIESKNLGDSLSEAFKLFESGNLERTIEKTQSSLRRSFELTESEIESLEKDIEKLGASAGRTGVAAEFLALSGEDYFQGMGDELERNTQLFEELANKRAGLAEIESLFTQIADLDLDSPSQLKEIITVIAERASFLRKENKINEEQFREMEALAGGLLDRYIDITGESETQKKHLESIVRLERERDRLSQTLQTRFTESTRQLELMRDEGLSRGVAGKVTSIESLIQSEIAAERAVLEARQGIDGLLSHEIEDRLVQREKELRLQAETYRQEQVAIEEMSRAKGKGKLRGGYDPEVNEEARNQMQRQIELAGLMSDSFIGAFRDIANGTETASDAFKKMSIQIIQHIMDILVWKPLIESMTKALSPTAGVGTGLLGALFPAANGAAINNGNVVPFAYGGVVNSPTMFGMSGGRTGLMGEAGPEAILPLKRGAGGKLGVEGGGNVTVQQNFNFAANGDESVKRIIAEAAPGIAKMTEAQIVNSRQRGGQMRRVFS